MLSLLREGTPDSKMMTPFTCNGLLSQVDHATFHDETTPFVTLLWEIGQACSYNTL